MNLTMPRMERVEVPKRLGAGRGCVSRHRFEEQDEHHYVCDALHD